MAGSTSRKHDKSVSENNGGDEESGAKLPSSEASSDRRRISLPSQDPQLLSSARQAGSDLRPTGRCVARHHSPGRASELGEVLVGGECGRGGVVQEAGQRGKGEAW
jgi:hypothetical protein